MIKLIVPLSVFPDGLLVLQFFPCCPLAPLTCETALQLCIAFSCWQTSVTTGFYHRADWVLWDGQNHLSHSEHAPLTIPPCLTIDFACSIAWTHLHTYTLLHTSPHCPKIFGSVCVCVCVFCAREIVKCEK